MKNLTPEQVVDLLKKAYEQILQKNPLYSLRALARDLSLSKSTLSALMRGERIPGPVAKVRIEEFLGLRGSSESADTPSRPYQETKIDPAEFELIADWIHFAILAAVDTGDSSEELEKLAGRFGISAEAADAAVGRLMKLDILRIKKGKIEKNRIGLFSVLDKRLDQAHKIHQQQIFDKAKEVLETPGDFLDQVVFDSRFFPMDDEAFKKVSGRIEQFVASSRQAARNVKSKSKKVYLLSVCCFPLER